MNPTVPIPLSTCEAIRRIGVDVDEAAWEQIISQHGAQFYRIANSVVNDPHLAEDAVQEALLVVRRAAPRFQPTGPDPEASACSWLRRAVLRSALYLARRQRHQQKLATQASHLPIDVRPDVVDLTFPDGDEAAAVRRGLAELPDRQRLPLMLHYYAGLGYEELARELQCSVNNARVRVHRARDMLRQRMQLVGLILAVSALDSHLCAAGSAAGSRVAGDAALVEGWRACRTADKPGSVPVSVMHEQAGISGAAILAAVAALILGMLWWSAREVPQPGTAAALPLLPHSSAAAAAPVAIHHYVVDQAHPAASDVNPGTANAPFLSIARATQELKPGDTVEIKEGVYREQIELSATGTVDRPITLRAAAGKRVVISGAEPISGWQPCTDAQLPNHAHTDKIWFVDLSWRPSDLYLDGLLEPLWIATWPNWTESHDQRQENHHSYPAFPVESGDTRHLVDVLALNQTKGFWSGAELQLHRHRQVSGSTVPDKISLRIPIVDYDPQTHALILPDLAAQGITLDPAINRAAGITDWYWIVHAPAMISKAGRYAIVRNGERFRCFVWPPDGIELNRHRVEGTRRAYGIHILKSQHVVLDGLEVARVSDTGIRLEAGLGNSVRHCTTHYCRREDAEVVGAGIAMIGERGSVIEHCLSVSNVQGIVTERSGEVRITGNVVGRNVRNGLMVSSASTDVHIGSNYIFDNRNGQQVGGLYTGGDVTGLELRNNLFLQVSSGWQYTAANNALVVGNMWAGIYDRGTFLDIGNRTAANQEMRCSANTFLIGDVSRGYPGHFTDNVCMNTSGSMAQSQGNLLWSRFVADQSSPIRFRSGPVFEAKVTVRNDAQGGGLDIAMGSAGCVIGDIVELNGDGVVRHITAVRNASVWVEPAPAADEFPTRTMVLWNWKDNASLQLDLRLAPTSRGAHQAEDGGPAGARIDIPAYQRGDVTGDGIRDVPDVPAEYRDDPQTQARLHRFLHW